VVIAETYHEGSLPGRGAFLRVDPHELAVVRAVKRAENGEGLVLRLVESVGRAVSFTLTGELLGRSVPATLAPYEVQTLLVPDDVDAPPRVVDVTEFDPPQTGMTG
jgi:alpha-mannosidase